jgi:hypothetical protein
MTAITYATDYAGWAAHQAKLLRAGRLEEIDLNQIADELDAIMGNEKRELTRRFRILIAHLLKWRYQSEARSAGWRGTIRYQRDDINDLLAESPSLRATVPDKVAAAYPRAVVLAADETGKPRSAFPAECPFTPTELLDDEFWPD